MDKAEIQDFAICGESFYIWCGGMYSVGKSDGNAEEYSRFGFEVWGNLGVASGGEFICQGNSGKNTCLLAGDQILSLSESGDPVSHIFAGGSSFDAVFAFKTGIYITMTLNYYAHATYASAKG